MLQISQADEQFQLRVQIPRIARLHDPVARLQYFVLVARPRLVQVLMAVFSEGIDVEVVALV